MDTSIENHFPARDGVALFERRWLPAGGWKAGVVLCHGYAEHSGRYQRVAAHLNEHGYAVFALDLRGYGKSPGERAFISSFDLYVDDLAAYIQYVRPEIEPRPIFLMGHSMGGLVLALYAATRAPSARGLVFSSPLLRVSDDVSPFLQRISGVVGALLPRLAVLRMETAAVSRDPEAVREYEADPLVYHGKILARTGAEITRATNRIQRHMEDIALPLIAIHGTGDRLCDCRGSQQLCDRAQSRDKTLRLFEGGYHELFNDLEKERFLAELTQWLGARV